MSDQHVLDLPFAAAMGREDFVISAANRDAAALIAAWRRWPERRLALTGPAGAGKTHLAHVFLSESGARRVDAATLTEAEAPKLLASGALAVEDADRMGAGAEQALFHLMNLAAQRGAALLITGRAAPSRWPVALPDLASRLRALTVARLSPPDEDLLAAVIAKQFQDRGTEFEPGLPDWLARRIERSFAAALDATRRLDAAALSRKRRPGRALAREILTELSP